LPLKWPGKPANGQDAADGTSPEEDHAHGEPNRQPIITQPSRGCRSFFGGASTFSHDTNSAGWPNFPTAVGPLRKAAQGRNTPSAVGFSAYSCLRFPGLAGSVEEPDFSAPG